MSNDDRIVVGVDGSDTADVALSWAYDQAVSTGAELDVVNVWSTPAIGEMVAMTAQGAFTDLERAAHRIVDDAVHRVVGHHKGVKVHRVVAHGYPPGKLVQLSENATLLVLGSRGHNAFLDLVLGSVSQWCADHALCPVVVIPPGDRRDRQRLENRSAARRSGEPAPSKAGAAIAPGEGELA